MSTIWTEKNLDKTKPSLLNSCASGSQLSLSQTSPCSARRGGCHTRFLLPPTHSRPQLAALVDKLQHENVWKTLCPHTSPVPWLTGCSQTAPKYTSQAAFYFQSSEMALVFWTNSFWDTRGEEWPKLELDCTFFTLGCPGVCSLPSPVFQVPVINIRENGGWLFKAEGGTINPSSFGSLLSLTRAHWQIVMTSQVQREAEINTFFYTLTPCSQPHVQMIKKKK